MKVLLEKKYLFLWLLVAIALIAMFLRGFSWTELFLILFSALSIVGVVWFSRRSPVYVSRMAEYTAALFVILAVVFGSVFGLYTKFPWYDTLLHTLSGVFVAAVAYGYILPALDATNEQTRKISSAILAVFVSLGVALLWELFEFGLDYFQLATTQMQDNNFDTMIDSLVALLGSLVGVTVAALNGVVPKNWK